MEREELEALVAGTILAGSITAKGSVGMRSEIEKAVEAARCITSLTHDEEPPWPHRWQTPEERVAED